VIRRGAVLVRDDKIVKVGPLASVKLPAGTTVVDVTGKHVVPGFVAIAAFGAQGADRTGPKDFARDSFDPFSTSMLFALGSGITTAHEGPSGGNPAFSRFFRTAAFGGSPTGIVGGVIGKLSYGTVEGFELRDPAGVYLAYGSSTGPQRDETRGALRAAREYIEKRRAWLADLAGGKQGTEEPKAPDNVKALARALEGELPVFVDGRDRDGIEAVLALSDEFDLKLVIHGVEEGWTVPAAIGRRRAGAVLIPRGDGFEFGRMTRPAREEYLDAPHGWTIENAAKLAAAGVPWATMTIQTRVDLGGLAGRDLTSLPLEAAFAVRGGVSNEEALRSITLTPAELLGVADRVGSLDPGKDADILVMDREPLDYRSFVEQAYVNGRLAYDKQREGIWSHIRTDRRAIQDPWIPYGPWPAMQEVGAPEPGVSGAGDQGAAGGDGD
jgi:imidazolonepropionase-like amidohydrolase